MRNARHADKVLARAVLVVLFLVMHPFDIASGRSPEDRAEKTPEILNSQPRKPAPGDNELRKLKIEKFNAALVVAKDHWKQIVEGRSAHDVFFHSIQLLIDAALDLTDNPAEQLAILTQHLEINRAVEKKMEEKLEAGVCRESDVAYARYRRIEVEIKILNAKSKLEKAK